MAGDPIGTIKVRADGTPWQKTEHGEDWKDLSGGGGAGKKAGMQIDKGPQEGPGDETSGANSGWKELQRSFGLDGHLPHETVHPSHVEIDIEGNTDAKPVLTWQDAIGNQRRSYTMEFHRERARALRGEVEKHATRIEAAYEILKGEVAANKGMTKGDVAAVAMIHLSTGHKIEHLLSLQTTHAAVPAQQDDEVDVEKSLGSNTPHPHRVHLIMPHVHGHVYPTSVVDKDLAAHICTKLKTRAFAKAEGAAGFTQTKLFDASSTGVESSLANVGASGISHATIRHHALMRSSVDLLSKLAPVDLSDPQGLDQVRLNIKQVSDEIAARYGHHPAPEEMAYIPPSVAMAYVEACGGHHLWPSVFPLEKSCTSTSPADSSSLEVSKSQPTSPSSGSVSIPATSAPLAKTHSPSPTRSVMQLHGRPWHQVADEVEIHLEKSGDPIEYDARLPPSVDGEMPRYEGPGTHTQDFEVVDGVRLKAEVAGKAVYLTFMGETEEAMQVILHGDEVRKFTVPVSDWQALTEAQWTERGQLLEQLSQKYHESIYGKREPTEVTINVTPGPQFGDKVDVEILPPPSPNRKEYPFVGQVVAHGLTIDLENLKGSVREGTDRTGKKWRTEMQAHYGEVRRAKGLHGVEGMDSDHIDVYVGPDPTSEIVVVIDQRVPGTGEVDEQKVCICFASADEAIAMYRRQYDDPGFFGGCIVLSMERFKEKLRDREQAGVPLTKSLVNMGDVFTAIVGIDPDPPPSKTKVAFQKAVANVMKALRRFKAKRAGAEDELSQSYIDYELARNAMCVDVTKAQPGPQGEQVGSTSVHADGETWEKRSDGWHDLGMQDAADAKKDDQTHEHSVGYDQAEATLIKLREKFRNTTDPKEKAVISQQIALVRKRMAGFEHAERIGAHTDNESKADSVEKSCTRDIEWAFTKDLQVFMSKSQSTTPTEALSELAWSSDVFAKSQAAALRRSRPDEFIAIISKWMVSP